MSVMWRVSVLLAALAVASCTAGGESSGEADRPPADSTVVAAPEETLPPVEDVYSAPLGSEEPLVPASADEFGPALDPATDPYFQRQSRPLLAVNPTETWLVDVDRVTVPFVDAVGDVIVVRTITPDDDQALLGLSRTDGGVA